MVIFRGHFSLCCITIMKLSCASAIGLALLLERTAPTSAASCGGGNVGDGYCTDPSLCCSQWGWCGSSGDHCGGYCGSGNVGNGVCADGTCCSEHGWCGTTAAHCGGGGNPPSPPSTPSATPAPLPPTTLAPAGAPNGDDDDNRLIAYLGNWQACPSTQQVSAYTHIMISFAVSYTWSPGKNICSETCEIATPPVCNNGANAALIQQWQAAGKKVLLSFGGAGMGGSWDGNNDCWEYCFGRETQVVNRLTEIVNEMGLDGVDIDYEYFYEDGQNGFNWNLGAEAQTFLTDVTVGLRNSLGAGSIVTHAPMDADLEPGKAYYDVLVGVGWALDFLMPQYYNGITRPNTQGVAGSGALAHFNTLKDNVFGGDATKIVFGFCISDCGGTGSNSDSSTAVIVMNELATYHACNGGAFFWVADHDTNGAWSSAVSNAISPSRGCSTVPSTPAPVSPPPPPGTPFPTQAPTPNPTKKQTDPPSPSPTENPTPNPTMHQTDPQTQFPTEHPTPNPTQEPSAASTKLPTEMPTKQTTTDGPTSSPTTSTPDTQAPISALIISTSPRCGTSEIDAREYCGPTCVSSADCESGQSCWGLHPNYCGSISKPNWLNPEVSTIPHRCGTSEIEAREFCGSDCMTAADCSSGEQCIGVNSNYCGSDYIENTPAPVQNTAAPVSAPPTVAVTAVVSPTALPTRAPTSNPTKTPTDPPSPSPTEDPTTSGDPIVSTSPRCGTSEIDAREYCRPTCVSSADCESGQSCWGLHPNYCGSVTKPNWVNPIISSVVQRCGMSEIDAREFCGQSCNKKQDCDWKAGDLCIVVNMNYCGSDSDEADGRMLRGS